MARQSQIIAVRKGAVAAAGRVRDSFYHQAQRKDDFTGFEKTFRPREEPQEGVEVVQLPPTSRHLQATADGLLRDITEAWTKMWDITLTMDAGNTVAKADVKLPDGRVLAKDVPVTTLLFLERQLIDVRTVISKIPTLDPAIQWEQGDGRWVSPPEITARDERVIEPLVLYQHTDKHPAQVTTHERKVNVGQWYTVNFAGGVKRERQRELLDRVETLIEAVKYAREAANATEVPDRKMGKDILGWLFR